MMSTRGLESSSLRSAIDDLSNIGRLLVVVDFDGTISEIVEEPSEAVPVPGAIDALEELSLLPGTRVGVLSGRALADLDSRTVWPVNVDLVGSHGAESRFGSAQRTTAGIESLVIQLEKVATEVAGARVERKPFGGAVHYRGVRAPADQRALVAAVKEFAVLRGLTVMEGKFVIEVATVRYDKGRAVAMLRRRTNSDAVLYGGDDRTDEHAFSVLERGDVGVKVGLGPSHAAYRVDDPTEMAKLLRYLVERRRARKS